MTLLQSPVGDHLPEWILVGLVASAFLFLRRLSGPQAKISHFPLLGKEYGGRRKRIEAFLDKPAEVYAEGYRRFKDQIYRLTMPDSDHLIIPARYLDELRQRSDEEIDVLKAFTDTFADDYIKLFPPKERQQLTNIIVRVDLTRNLTRLNPRLSAEVDKTVNSELPECQDWTPLQIVPILLRIVAIVSGNLFIGPENCRHEAYINSAIHFTTDCAAASAEVKRFPKWLRPIIVALGFVPSLGRIQGHRKQLHKLLAPMVNERRQLKKEGKPVPEDVLQWMVEKLDEAANGKMRMDHLVQCQLLLIVAAIHTTTLSATAMLYDLAMHPELIQDIRKEIVSVLEEANGVMTTQALFNMKLLDSFMRESQRFTPPFVDSFRRYVQKPITLKDGTHIPQGVFIETPSLAVLHDEQIYPDAESFDPRRFYELRTNEQVADPNSFRTRESYQFVSVTKENTTFGYGKHACPGRFFAANEIKLILARILLQYDVRLPLDVKERYPNFYHGSASGPSPVGVVEFKRINKS